MFFSVFYTVGIGKQIPQRKKKKKHQKLVFFGNSPRKDRIFQVYLHITIANFYNVP